MTTDVEARILYLLNSQPVPVQQRKYPVASSGIYPIFP